MSKLKLSAWAIEERTLSRYVGWGGGAVADSVKDVSKSNMCIVYGISQFKRSDEVKVGNTEPGNFFRRTAVAVQVPTRRIVFFF